MELALACRLRAHHAVPDSALRQLIRHRTRLHRLFRQAYEQRLNGLGAPTKVKSDGCGSIYLRGVFLDLRLNFSGGRFISFGLSTLLSPPQAIAVYAYSDLAARALPPINISSYLKNWSINRFLLQSFDERLFLHGERLRRGCPGNAAANRDPINITPIYLPVDILSTGALLDREPYDVGKDPAGESAGSRSATVKVSNDDDLDEHPQEKGIYEVTNILQDCPHGSAPSRLIQLAGGAMRI
jgi:hypothetical protein